MNRTTVPAFAPALAIGGGLAAAGACGLSVAFLGLGVPFILAAILSGTAVGALLYAAAKILAPSRPPNHPPNRDRTIINDLDRAAADLRHAIRGALTPAMLVSDRLLRSDDPAIQRAGQTVTKSVDRAIELIVQHNKDTSEIIAAPTNEIWQENEKP